VERRLAAILAADVVGYSRLIREDESGTLAELKAHREQLFEPKIAERGGRIVKLMGDGLLVEFPSAVDAVRCAVEIQHLVSARNADRTEDSRVTYRIGINIGDIVVEDDDIYGDGVNVAARLEGLSEPSGICMARNVFDQVKDKLDLTIEHLGEHEIKNIDEPVTVYRVVLDDRAAALVTPVVRTAVKPTRRRWLAAASATAVLVAVVGGVFLWRPWAPDVEPASVARMAFPLPDKPSIAVLPFDDLGGDPGQAYFVEGFTENVITELSRFRNLFVIARNSTATYKGQPIETHDVAEDLGVHYVLEGSVQRAENRIRITVQMIDALTGRHLWGERYDRDMQDLFAVQDEVTQHIVATLAAETGLLADAWRNRTARERTDSLKAYELDLQGWAAYGPWTKEGFSRAEELFERAIAADPDYARPYANLALILSWQYYAKFTDEAALHRAVDLAKEAIARDDGEAWGHWALGAAYLALGKHDEAVAAYERALELNPNDADVLAESSFLFSWVGRAEEAIANVAMAMRLNPRHDDWYLWGLGVAYYDARQYREAAEALSGRKKPNLKSNLYLAAAYGQLGRQADAKAVVEAILAENRESSIELWGEAQPYRNPADQAHYIEGLRKAGLPEESPLALPDKPSIAVLALEDLSTGDDRDYLSDAISEGIITELSRYPELFIIARNSSFHYREKATDGREISRELGVRYVLAGSQQKAGDRIRVAVQLIDAVAGNHVWAETYDRDLADIFRVQDEISDTVASTLGEKLVRIAGEEAKRADPARLSAFEHWLKGIRHFREFSPEGSERARVSYLRAIEADPTLARGHSGLAWVYINGYRWGWTELDRQEALARAREEAQTALELAPDDYSSHFAMASVHMQAGEREQAIIEFEKTLQLVPNNGTVMANLSEALVYVGRTREAIEMTQNAMRLDPHHPEWFYWNLGWAQYFAGDCEAALATMRKMSRMPKLANRTLAASHVCLGQLDEARAAIATLLKDDPEYSLAKLRLNLMDKFEDPVARERFIDDLRAAGLPE
jgi:adenylate cyclase